jgi:transposase
VIEVEERHDWTDEEVARMAALRREGHEWDKVARLMGLSVSSVKSKASRLEKTVKTSPLKLMPPPPSGKAPRKFRRGVVTSDDRDDALREALTRVNFLKSNLERIVALQAPPDDAAQKIAERALTMERMSARERTIAAVRIDWTNLDPLMDKLIAEGMPQWYVAEKLGVSVPTYVRRAKDRGYYKKNPLI